MDHETKNDVIYQMQDPLDRLEHDYENLMEQIRLADQQRFGRHTEKLSEIAGQISLFNEVEACFDEQGQEPSIDDVVDTALKPLRRPKKKGPPGYPVPGQHSDPFPAFWDHQLQICEQQSAGSYRQRVSD